MNDAFFYDAEGCAWCPSCGDLISQTCGEDIMGFPDECRQCGYPEDLEKMAEYHG